ncbi:MAG: sensor histidine kinase, partial [Spirochaetaceae bacterium]|nr:sensor histidine kinase [Spirochaetaceae bacterium]
RAARRANVVQRGNSLRADARTLVWVSISMALLALLIFFYNALLGPQMTFASDRADLLGLRELWVASAAGFGLRSEPHPREDFMDKYRTFRSRPSVKILLKEDSEFNAFANEADSAFSRLETAELRGEAGAALAAADFDDALGGMASRVAIFARGQLEGFRLIYLGIIVVLLAAILGFVFFETRLRASSAGEERNRALSRALIAAQEGERLRISRELHDAVAQDLAAAKLYCGLSDGPDAARAGMLLERAIEEVRSICYGMRPAELDRLGIAKAAFRLCSEAGREGGFEVAFSVDGLDSVELDPEIEITFYRVLQEALSNIKRHSKAEHARVRITASGGQVELIVEDDGTGAGSAAPGMGRTGMEERARMIGGSYRFGSGSRGGTVVRVSAPIRRKEVS